MKIVAEIGLNYDGNFDLAYELIRRAALAGVDIAKFQFGWRHTEGEINHITPAQAARLKSWCRHWGVEFMASVFNDEGFALFRELDPDHYKIASRTVVDNPALVEKVLAEGKETFMSLGFWDKEEWPFGPPTEQLRYIHCISKYPTYPTDLAGFPERFSADGLYGYSDHTHGVETCLLAIARGANFIEKHFTLDKTKKSVHNDHVLSASPEELELLCRVGRDIARVRDFVNA